MNEWLLLNAKWAISELFHGENKLHFDEDIGGDDNMSTLYYTTLLVGFL